MDKTLVQPPRGTPWILGTHLDKESGLQGTAGENGGIGGSACDDLHSWRF